MKTYQAPFDDKGNLLQWGGYSAIEWREIETWRETMNLVGMYSGRSAKGFIWIDSQGHRFPMFASDLENLIKKSTITFGTVTADWTINKKGESYGIGFAG